MSSKLTIPKIETLIATRIEENIIITHVLMLEGAYKIMFNHKKKAGNLVIFRHPNIGFYDIHFSYGKHKDKIQFTAPNISNINDICFILSNFMDLFENYYGKKNRNR